MFYIIIIIMFLIIVYLFNQINKTQLEYNFKLKIMSTVALYYATRLRNISEEDAIKYAVAKESLMTKEDYMLFVHTVNIVDNVSKEYNPNNIYEQEYYDNRLKVLLGLPQK